MKRCPRCGARNPDDAIYCKKCGAYLGDYNEPLGFGQGNEVYKSRDLAIKKKNRWNLYLAIVYILNTLFLTLVIAVFIGDIITSKNSFNTIFYTFCGIFVIIALFLNIISSYYSLKKKNFTLMIFTFIMNIMSLFGIFLGVIAFIISLVKRDEFEE